MFSTLESTYGGCAPVHYNNIDYLHINFTKLKINKTGYELWHAKGKHPLIVFNFIIRKIIVAIGLKAFNSLNRSYFENFFWGGRNMDMHRNYK